MKDLLLTLLHLTVMTATLCGPGGVRAVIVRIGGSGGCRRRPVADGARETPGKPHNVCMGTPVGFWSDGALYRL